jgi:hypothetical protein
MRNAGIQPTQLLQQQQHHPSQQQQQPPPPQPPPQGGAMSHPGLQGHVYGNHIGGVPGGRGVMGDQIRDVWATNLEQEFAQVRNLITQYPFVSMVALTFPVYSRSLHS